MYVNSEDLRSNELLVDAVEGLLMLSVAGGAIVWQGSCLWI